MNGKKAKALRKVLGHHPSNEVLYYPASERNKKTWVTSHCTRATYQQAKRHGEVNRHA